MSEMIKEIRIWDDNPDKSRVSNIVKVEFNYPTEWCVFTVDELLQIIRLWIKGEEIKYPPSKGFKGRWMLFEAIRNVFNEKMEVL